MFRAKSVLTLRKPDHCHTRLQLAEERAHAYRLIPWLALVNVAFGFVDWALCPGESPLTFFGIRALAVVVSRALYLLARGRTRYGMRIFFTVAPYMYAVEYIMLTRDLAFGPYFSGLLLVMVTCTMLFPVSARISYFSNTACVLPVVLWTCSHPSANLIDTLCVNLMLAGGVLVCSVNSGQVYRDLCTRFRATEALARHLGRREKEVRKKAEELLKRRIFESQFSPQVVAAVLQDRTIVREMRHSIISNIVIDIENSTYKASSLPPGHYKEVIEEVLDVFSAACLKWNITLDKFTGDGVQAFAGAPVAEEDDYLRAVMACGESIQMLGARKASLGSLWNDPLNVRFAICRGTALVGFIGRGIFKSYTAVGDVVSFTHRLSSIPPPWAIATYDWTAPNDEGANIVGFTQERKTVTGIKGFADRVFPLTILHPEQRSDLTDAGRCLDCGTPLVMDEGIGGLPRVYCPGCKANSAHRSAA